MGSELSVDECSSEAVDDACLSHGSDAIVFCGASSVGPFADGELRLLDASSAPALPGSAGRLEVYLAASKMWAPVCKRSLRARACYKHLHPCVRALDASCAYVFAAAAVCVRVWAAARFCCLFTKSPPSRPCRFVCGNLRTPCQSYCATFVQGVCLPPMVSCCCWPGGLKHVCAVH